MTDLQQSVPPLESCAVSTDRSKYKYTVVVQFKYGRIGEFGGTFMVSPGDYVVLQTTKSDQDFGTDFGRVIQCSTTSSVESPSTQGMIGDVVRLGTADEATHWLTTLGQQEEDFVQKAMVQVRRMNLDLNIVGAECQWDSSKVTFYYESSSYVDFASFLQAMYRKFKCRMWMEKVPRDMNLVSPLCKKNFA